jgi:uncharacterized membrane protein YeaQ/YmgE (transglycosylase-associated protein family)
MSDQVRSVIIWVVVGVIVGWLGALVVGGSLWLYVVVGLIGAIVVGLLAQWLKLGANMGHPLVADGVASLIGAVIGVLVLIFVG